MTKHLKIATNDPLPATKYPSIRPQPLKIATKHPLIVTKHLLFGSEHLKIEAKHSLSGTEHLKIERKHPKIASENLQIASKHLKIRPPHRRFRWPGHPARGLSSFPGPLYTIFPPASSPAGSPHPLHPFTWPTNGESARVPEVSVVRAAVSRICHSSQTGISYGSQFLAASAQNI